MLLSLLARVISVSQRRSALAAAAAAAAVLPASGEPPAAGTVAWLFAVAKAFSIAEMGPECSGDRRGFVHTCRSTRHYHSIAASAQLNIYIKRNHNHPAGIPSYSLQAVCVSFYYDTLLIHCKC